MVSHVHVVACASLALAFWTAIGLPVARRLLPRETALPFAPLIGWALHGTFALAVFRLAPSLVPFSRTGLVVVTLAAIALGRLALGVDRSPPAAPGDGAARVPPAAWAAAAALAIACAIAILPKQAGDAIRLSEQIFDHAKVAMVDDMVRLGLPAGNPFFADDAGSGRLSYYYLLHFTAAELALAGGVTGWEADVAMTFFAAFTSLAAMMALAVRFGGRASAASWVVALAATSSARVLMLALFGEGFDDWLAPPGGFGGWLFQAAWVPQHLASTTCVIASVLLLEGLARRAGVLAVVVTALVVVAGFESSTWVGGLVFALVAAIVVPVLLWRVDAPRRTRVAIALVAVGLLALLVALPFVQDQVAASARRGTGFPVAVRLQAVVGDAWPSTWRRLLDGPAWWLAFLPVALPAMYVAGVPVALRALRGRGAASSIAITTLVALVAAWLLVSTIADNNDLGWRAGLLGSVGLIVFAAAGIASWIAERRRLAVALATVALLLGVPEAVLQVQRNATGRIEPDGTGFARAPALWQAVRDHSRPDERIASNPQAFEHMTPWPDNIGWALLADRRSCYAGWELTQVFTSVPHDRLRRIDALFRRLFETGGSADEVRTLAREHDCAVAVVTREDGAWDRDPFRASADYALVEERPDWRIYRRRPAPSR